MSDVRSLLKARRQEIRIDHPLASYTSSGQLRCTVCDTNIKHPSAWDGHLGSKAHRTNAARVREEERRRQEQELNEANRLKRKIPEDDTNEDQGAAKKSRIGATSASQPSTSTLPPNFFSDPSRAPVLSLDDSDDDGEMGGTAAPMARPTGGEGDSVLDQEWLRFQQSVINVPDAADAYDRATIVAEPELVVDQSEGLPTTQDDAHPSSATKVDEDERRRKEQEERELIMDRLMDEERAQEEADMKVIVMKNRLAVLRQKREASRSTKSNLEVV